MTKTWSIVMSSLLGLLTLTACSSASESVVSAPVLSETPQAVVKKDLPTPASTGQMIVYNDLQVMMQEAEITTSYLTEYDSNREPPAGKEIIWIHILLKNIGQNQRNLPAPEHFSVLNGTTEFKAIYGHRKDHVDYLSLTPILVEGQEADAWLRFDIPSSLELRDLIFAFLPESSQISVDFSPSDYPWGDHPIYLWTCAK